MFTVDTETNQQNSSVYDIEVRDYSYDYFIILNKIIQLGQGTLGLQDPDYYKSETPITIAYRQFIIDLATELVNNTSINETDVQDIYTFEKNISQVN